MTLTEAAQVLGVSPDTLRWQIHNGKLRAKKVGPVWTVTPREVERYRRESLDMRRRATERLEEVVSLKEEVDAWKAQVDR